ncbi:MAG: threonylcarbamoyl-AMP synthase [Tissierellia bacterium]|nr:threonylcarbamoyl-AMP synthase [Tissierellia bacterium]
MSQIFRKELNKAAAILKEGGTVIFPTETVYGLGARFDDDEALGKIFLAKGRPRDNPLILHIYKRDQLDEITEFVPPEAEVLIDKYWPGPLTMIFKKKSHISDIVSGGLDTVAVRMPSHPVALELLSLVDLPLAAPSANISGRPSPTSEDHLKEMEGRVDAIVLGGDCQVGLESTVIDLSRARPILLRPGRVSLEELEELLGPVDLYENKGEFASPGLKYKHYAPKTPLVLLEGSDEEILDFIKQNAENCVFIVKESILRACETQKCELFYPEGDLNYAAKEYFRLIRRLDSHNYDIIYITALPTEGLGRAIMDRVVRSSGGRTRRL